MRKVQIVLLAIVLLGNISCNNNSNPNVIAESESFAQVLEDFYEEGLLLDPIRATKFGEYRYNNRFPNFLSDEYRSSFREYYTRYLDQVSQYNDKELSEDDRISKSIILWECEINLEGLAYRDDLFPIYQTGLSLHLIIGQYAVGSSAQPFKTLQDYKNWMERVDEYLKWLNTAEIKMSEGIERGIVLPKALIMKIIPQFEPFTIENIAEHLFYKPIKNLPGSFSAIEKKDISEQYTTMIRDEIIPAYKKMLQFLSTEYLIAGRESSGYSNLPDGKAWYNHRLKLFTTTNMTADEIHQLGLNEVARIRKEMEKAKNEIGFSGDLKSFFDYVVNNQELMQYTEPQQVLDNFNDIHERMKPQLGKLFDLKPKASFEVRQVEAFRAKSASAQYKPGSFKNGVSGVFYVPVPEVSKYNTFKDESLFLHEAVPGHHYQISLQQENEKLPKFRRTYWSIPHLEGWALYTESLGKELGLYNDPFQYFGNLCFEMLRAVRLVVDTGLHAKGWTREKAIEYFLENVATTEAKSITQIERYMAVPGQAVTYKIGQLKILELRAKAEKELGDKFDIKDFHNQLLEPGCLPLELLEDKINNWIAEF